MKAINEKERTVWSSNDGKYENVFNPTLPKHVDSISKNSAKRRSQYSFVVPWQMTKEGEIANEKSIPQPN